MRLSVVLLLVFLASSALAQGINYKGCQNQVSHSGQNSISSSATSVGDCQTFCSVNVEQVGGFVGLTAGTAGQVVCHCNFVGTATAESNCPNVCPGATFTQGKHCGGSSASIFAVYTLTCTGICDDPHFTGLDGSRYEYMATADRVVALISDRTVQVNGRFVAWKDASHTVIGQVGVRVCDHTVELFANRTIVLDGRAVLDLKFVAATATLSPALIVKRHSINSVRLYAGNWRMSIQMSGKLINIMGIVHLDKNDTFVHGAFGVTGLPAHHQLKKELCGPWNEGGCELPGKWQDYELPVGASIFSTEWTYKQFDVTNCASLAQETAKLQNAEDAKLAAIY